MAFKRITRRRVSRRFKADAVQPLELRRLMSVVASTPLPEVDVTSGQYPTTIDLDDYFSSTTVTGTAVEFQVSYGDTSGKIDVGLYDSAVPTTVANFLKYVNSGAYNGSLFHKSVASTATASFIQGGGYYFPSGASVPTLGSVSSEIVHSPGYGTTGANVAGTIAMYKDDGQTNQATSQFLINTANNSSSFDLLTKGYTVFGRVLGSGMTLVNQINALSTEAFAAPFDALPVTNYTSGSTLAQQNIVAISTATVVNGISYTVDSSARDLVIPIVAADGTVSLNYQPNVTGTATISITATDLDGATTSSSFEVHLADGGNLSASLNGTRVDPNGTATTKFGNIPVTTGTTVTRSFVIENTGSEALSHISYAFADGSAGYSLLNAPATTLASGDTTTVTVKIDTSTTGDKAGTLTIADPDSGTSLISLPLEANIQQLVTLAGKVTSVTYVQGTGASATTATFKLGNAGTGTATFSLSGANLVATTKGASVVVSGAATLDELDLTNTNVKSSITMSSKGAAQVSIGTVTGVGTASLGSFAAKTAILTGQLTWGSTTSSAAQLTSVTLGTLNGARVLVGPTNGNPAFSLTATTVTNSYVTIGDTIKAVVATTWGGGGLTSTRDLLSFTVKSGAVSTSVGLTGSLGTAKIAGGLSGGEWDVGGDVKTIQAGSGSDTFAMAVTGVVNTAKFAGDFSGTISAQAIGSFTAVSGNGTTLVAKGTSDGTNPATGGILKSIVFKGNVATGYFNAANVIGSISANSLTRSRLYAGTTIGSSQVLPTVYSAFAATSEIGSIKLAGKGVTYAYQLNVIAARSIASASLGSVLPTSGTANGLAASTVGTFGAIFSGKKVSAKNISTQGTATALTSGLGSSADFAITILSPSA